MEEKSNSIFKSALIPGVILAAVLIIISLISYIFDLLPKGLYVGTIISVSTFIIRIVVLAIFTKQYRDKIENGLIKYGKALAFGLIMGVYASFIMSAYSFAFNTVIDPNYTKEATEKVQKMTIENLYEKGMSDDMVEMMEENMTKKEFPSPLKSSLTVIISGIIFSLLASLISSLFVKKNEDPYQEMQDINEE